MGRLPVLVGKTTDGHCISFESFAYHKLGYRDAYELGPGEIVRVDADGYRDHFPRRHPHEDLRVSVGVLRIPELQLRRRERRGHALPQRRHHGARRGRANTVPDVDYVAGVPDSGVPHAIGYSSECRAPFGRPFIKYTPTWPRSFMPANQDVRNRVAKMKLIPVPELIRGKKLLFVDDSIVRGTQLRGTVDYLYESGAAEVHMRSACPPIMFGCKYLSFSRSRSEMELIARRVVQDLEGDEGQRHLDEYADGSTERGKCLLPAICEQMGFDSLGYQSLDGMLEAIGIDRDEGVHLLLERPGVARARRRRGALRDAGRRPPASRARAKPVAGGILQRLPESGTTKRRSGETGLPLRRFPQNGKANMPFQYKSGNFTLPLFL